MKKTIMQILVLMLVLVMVSYFVYSNMDFLTTEKGRNICRIILFLIFILPVIYIFIKSSNTISIYKKKLIEMYDDNVKLENFPPNEWKNLKAFSNIHFAAKIEKYNCNFRYYTFKRLERHIDGSRGQSYMSQYDAVEYIFNLGNQPTLLNENTILTVKDKFGNKLSAKIKENNFVITKCYSLNKNITKEDILIDVKNIKELYENVYLEIISKSELSQIPNVEIDEETMKLMKNIESLKKIDGSQLRSLTILLIIVIIITIVVVFYEPIVNLIHVWGII